MIYARVYCGPPRLWPSGLVVDHVVDVEGRWCCFFRDVMYVKHVSIRFLRRCLENGTVTLSTYAHYDD